MARVVLGGVTIAESGQALRVLETSHPPGVYLPPDAFVAGALVANRRRSVCEWKGTAHYWDLRGGGKLAEAAAWSYPQPRHGYEQIAGYISVYPGRVDGSYLDGELVAAQDGNFYGGWITSEILGPFKGSAGTWGW